ncbi:MAG: ATP-binding protein [Candidatus Aenigmarchaeota archaeon]|nr:ATP-binding protein [Candidatus Aenigmarchaeota archaeon]
MSLYALPKKIRKIIVFSGIRRAGKTYMMFQMIRQLAATHPKESIFYINFEDERIEKTKESLTKVLPALLKLYGERSYFLFLDEPQIMPEWSRWLRRVYDSHRNISLYVSGSSSKLSSKEIPTELRGRGLTFEVFPLGFRDFLLFRGVELEKGFELSERKVSMVKRLLSEYIKFGGFPEVALEDSEATKKKIVQEYFRTIVLRDICERNRVKKTELMNDFLRLLLNTKLFSVNKMYNILRSQGKKAGKETLIKYTGYCEGAYFCFFVPVLSAKIKNQMQYPKKAYFADNGFITNISLRFGTELERLYENAVFLGLRSTKSDNTEIYYWRDQQGREVDFVVKEGFKVSQLIQVCYDVSDYEIKKREVKALLRASKELKCNNLLLITGEQESEETIKGKKIKYISLWKWLLGM